MVLPCHVLPLWWQWAGDCCQGGNWRNQWHRYREPLGIVEDGQGLWECLIGKEPLGAFGKTNVALNTNLGRLGLAEVSSGVSLRASR